MFDKNLDTNRQTGEAMLQSDPARDLLFSEHGMLLRSAEVSHLVNRIILLIIILFDILYASRSIRMNLALFVVGLITAFFWNLQSMLLRRNINHLEELIVETYAERLDNSEMTEQPIHLRPVEKTDDLDLSRSDDLSLLRRSAPEKQTWITAYVNWRHDRWKQSRFETFERLEPTAWLLLLIGLIVAKLFVP
jgi:hypothetical protein